MPSLSFSRTGIAAALGCAGLLLVGWSSLLVPSLIRSIESDFSQSDAGIGVFFFVNSVAYVAGSMLGGLLTEWFGRRVVFPLAVILIAVGLSGMATVPTWELFLAVGIPFGLGAGAIDGGSNGLVLDLYPTSRGRALNLLHLFFSLGALASPLVVGRLVEAGVAWQSVSLGTALAAMSAIEPAGRAADPAGAAGNDAVTASRRLMIKAPAMPPNRAATRTTMTPPATMAEVTPAPRPARPPPPEEGVLEGWSTEGSGTGEEAPGPTPEPAAWSGSADGGG